VFRSFCSRTKCPSHWRSGWRFLVEERRVGTRKAVKKSDLVDLTKMQIENASVMRSDRDAFCKFENVFRSGTQS
jgi:hypothetical protein